MITPPQSRDETDAIEGVDPVLAEVEKNYRCPACGRLVNAANPEEILLHHEHVTHPDRYHFTKHAA